MLDHTAKAEVDGVKFDGVDLFRSIRRRHRIDDDAIKSWR